MNYKRLIPIFIPLFIWALIESFYIEPDLFYVSLSLGVLILIFSVRALVPKAESFWVPFALPPVLFLAAFSAYAAVLVGSFWLQLIALLNLWYLFVYLRGVYYYFARPNEREQWGAKFDNLMLSGSFLTAFSGAALLFELPAFLDWPLYQMLPSIALLSAALFSEFRLLPREGAPYDFRLPLGSVILLTEMAGVLALLPLNFNILALFFAIFYYLCLTVIRLSNAGSLNWRSLRLPVIAGFIIIILLLLTARWL